MRRVRRIGPALLSLLTLSLAAARADVTLTAAYRAILDGDYQTGKKVLAELAQRPEETVRQQAKRARDWLEHYIQMARQREKLRAETYEWNIEQARKAIEQHKTYLALSFAAQAAPYARDRDDYGKLDWVQALREQALREVAEFEKNEKWAKAHSYYTLLLRIYEHDPQLEQRRDRVARHLRLQFLYKTDEDVQRRLKDVTYDMLDRAVRLINDNYYKDPDFAEMADGAIDYLVALCHTTKLYEGSKVFDGIADPLAREHFLSRLEALRSDVHSADHFDYRDLLALFRDVRKVSEATVSLPEELLIVEFLEGAVSRLDDYTSVVWPADSSEFDKMMMGNFFGVGIQLGVDEYTGRLKVITPLANSPALRAGIQPGDLIVEVDGESTRDWTTDKAVREITGPEGTIVKLTIYRPSTGERITFPLKRSRIQITTVRGVQRLESETGDKWDYMLDRELGVAYIQLTGFNPDSFEELTRALHDAQQQGMKGLVFDLRHNPGGLLDVAVDVVSEFLERGDVVSTRGRAEPRRVLKATGKSEYPDLPLVVLVNSGSASASEIVSGALRDHHRALIIGERTFGKGSVQRLMWLDRRLLFGGRPKARIKLTTALYYLPSGRSPHREPGAKTWGVDPDRKVVLTPKEYARVLKREQESFIIHNESPEQKKLDEEARKKRMEALKADTDEDEEPDEDRLLSDEDIKLLQADPYEAPDVDPQLETALLYLRIKLSGNLPWPQELVQKTGQTP